ncbi:BNR-4 repeat-containing protein [Pseudoalteromonas rubra]|nr:BNR-4 repeat-containing protein [Pseudoalteromonas rubra]
MIKKELSTFILLAGALGSVPGHTSEIESHQSEIVSAIPVDNSNQAGWWSPMARHNGATYFAYNYQDNNNTGQHKVYVTRLDSNGNSTTTSLKEVNFSEWVHKDDFGHDQPSIAVDGNGRVHVWADMHADADGWHYFRSQPVGNDSTMELLRNNELTDSTPNTTGAFTYPIAATAPNGDIYLIVRNQPGRHNTPTPDYKGVGELYHWENTISKWRLAGTFAEKDNAVVYPDDIAVDKDGNVHILWEWAYSHPRANRHYGSYLQYRPSEDAFFTAAGTRLTSPATTTTPGVVFQGVPPSRSFNSNDNGIQTAKLAVYGAENKVSIAYRFYNDNKYQLYRKRWNGAWTQRETLESRPTIAALGHTHNGQRARVYYTLDGNTPNQNRLQVIERYTNTPWQKYVLSSKNIERIHALELNSQEDLLYGVEICSGTTQKSDSSGHCSHSNGAKLSILKVGSTL